MAGVPVRNESHHAVCFYDREEELSRSVGHYLGEGLAGGGSAVVVATAAHRLAFDAALGGRGIDVGAARDTGRLRMVDAAETLDGFMVGDRIDPARFEAAAGNLIGPAARAGQPVRIYAEMVAVLWEAGQVPLALELEDLWNAQTARSPFSLLCAYPDHLMAGDENSAALGEVCQLHADVHRQRGFPYVLDSVREARHFVVGALESLYDRRVTDDAAIVVTELAANAFQHAESGFTVAVDCSGGEVWISVRDYRPLNGARPLSSPPGHGLDIVAQIADRWGTDRLPDGKAVWARLPAKPIWPDRKDR